MSPLKPNSLTERDLIERSLKGDRISQRDLFDMYSAKMLAVCQRYTRHRAEAEDMFQEGFIRVFSNLDKFKYDGSFEGWVRRIMINTALKSIKKKDPISRAISARMSGASIIKLKRLTAWAKG